MLSKKNTFEPIWIVEPRTSSDGRNDIHFKINQPDKVTIDQAELFRDLESTQTAIHTIFYKNNNERYSELIDRLLFISQLGLVGKNVSGKTAIARNSLHYLQDEIVSIDSLYIKNKFLKDFMIYAVLLSLPALVFSIFLYFLSLKDQIFLAVYNLMFVWVFTMIGVWISFASRKLNISFMDLTSMDEGKISAFLRLMFSGLVSISVSIVLMVGIITIKIGNFDASKWTDDTNVAIVLGLLLGLSEKMLPNSLIKKAQNLV